MTRTKNALEKLEGAIEEAIDRRTATFDNHSEKWQESEKGEEYQELTDRLQEMLDEVIGWIDELDQ